MTEVRSAQVGPRRSLVASLVVVEPTEVVVTTDALVDVSIETTSGTRLFVFAMLGERRVTVYEDVRVLAYARAGSAHVRVWVAPAREGVA